MTTIGPVRGNLIETVRVGKFRLGMTKRSPFRYFKTSPEVIRLVVMLYVRFSLSLRNVEDLLHERGIDVIHETVRFWWNRFGPIFAAEIREKRADRMRCGTQWRWHLDEVFVKINGELYYRWRAVDHEGEVLETYVTKRRDRKAALKLLRKSMKGFGSPQVIVTNKMRSYGAAMKEIGNAGRQETGRWLNNRAENSHLPFRRRERAMLRFRRIEFSRNSLPSTRPSTIISIRNVTSTHATISSSSVPPLLPNGVNLVRHKSLLGLPNRDWFALVLTAPSRLLSTKAAFLWGAIRPGEFSRKLVERATKDTALLGLGFMVGVYKSTEQPTFGCSDINTNGIVLEALAYAMRGGKPMSEANF